MPCSKERFNFKLPTSNFTNNRYNIFPNLKIITFLILFNSTTSEAYHPGVVLILSALANAAHRPIASISHGSSSSTHNRKFLETFPGLEEKELRQKFVAQPGVIDSLNGEEVFDQREFVRISQRQHETVEKYEKRVYSKLFQNN